MDSECQRNHRIPSFSLNASRTVSLGVTTTIGEVGTGWGLTASTKISLATRDHIKNALSTLLWNDCPSESHSNEIHALA